MLIANFVYCDADLIVLLFVGSLSFFFFCLNDYITVSYVSRIFASSTSFIFNQNAYCQELSFFCIDALYLFYTVVLF